MTKSPQPVWVRGRVAYRTRRAVSLAVMDRFSRERHHVLPRSLISGERDTTGPEPLEREFLVPAWWAHKAKVGPLVYDIVNADYTQAELRVLAGQPFNAV